MMDISRNRVVFCCLVVFAGCKDETIRDTPPGVSTESSAETREDAGAEASSPDEVEATSPLVPALTDAQDRAAELISAENMRDDLDYLASDALGGRVPGSPGHALAREYIARRAEEAGLVPLGTDDGFIWSYAAEGERGGAYMLAEDGTVVERPEVTAGHNVIGYIPGSDPVLSEEYIVYLAHYDHLGVEPDGSVYNGAFDDASGVAVGLEMARAIVEAEAAPLRSLVFLFTDEEEEGLHGAAQWMANPTVPPGSIVLGISGDPLGRRILPDYGPILISGLERSPELLALWRHTVDFAESDVVFVHRDAIPVFSSDQDALHAAPVPVPAAWFINPGMTFYHSTDDVAETIDYRMMVESAQYMARSLMFVGNTGQRFEYVGPPPIDGAAATDFRGLPVGMLGSTVLTDDEREQLQEIVDDLDTVIAADTIEVMPSPMGFFMETIYFVAFELPQRHPGQIPPPFPD